MKIRAIINDVTKTSDPDFIKYSEEAVNNGIDDTKAYVVVHDSTVIGIADIKYDFPKLEITANCYGFMTEDDAKNSMLERSGLVWEADENHIITKWDLCNFTLRNTKDGEVSNIVEFSNE